MSQQGVYKTNVTCTIGLSVQTPSGDWEKSGISISSDIGPGYPEASLMQVVLKQQMDDATRGAEEWIEAISNKIIEQVKVGV